MSKRTKINYLNSYIFRPASFTTSTEFIPLVMYAARSTTPAAIEEEIGEKEGEFIRRYLPPLNYQIPKAENWR